MKTLRKEILEYVSEQYGTVPDNPWQKYRYHQVLRHSNNKKWYGLIMRVKRPVVGLDGNDDIDIINIKCEPLAGDILIREGKAYPAYHMNKEHWISVLLDGTIDKEEVFNLIDISYELTMKKK